MNVQPRCTRCRELIPAPPAGSCTTGYGVDDKGRKYCFECCAVRDRQHMNKHGRITLYLTRKESGRYVVTNWPGSLVYIIRERSEGKHNIAGTRQDVWFHDGNGDRWHGTQYGQWSDLCHCRRLKTA